MTTGNTSAVRRLSASLLVVPVDSFFSRAEGCFGVGRRPTKPRAAKPRKTFRTGHQTVDEK